MKPHSNWEPLGWRGNVLAFFSGVILHLSLAPHNKWFLGMLAVTILASMLHGQRAKAGFYRSLCFGFGMYLAGTSWVYVSIHEFGNAPAPLAFVMTGLFVCFLALVFALPFYFYCKYVPPSRLSFIIGFPSVWILGEWLRSWLLTGFPWLYLGYGHLGTWLSGWAPILGVYGVGWMAIASGNCVKQFIYGAEQKMSRNRQLVFKWDTRDSLLLCSIVTIWLTGFLLKNIAWVKPGQSLHVAMVQPNIPLEMKWQPIYQSHIMDTLQELSQPAWQADLVIWPEAAVPLLFNDATAFLEEIEAQASASQSAFITGILYDDRVVGKYYNAIAGFGEAEKIYFKQRLVPFGEYVPFESQLRGLIEFFDLPNSIIHQGPKAQENLKVSGYTIAPYICYEIVYPDLVASKLRQAEVIVTISNDAWFGQSIGPLQHYQMAQMRALENGRYVIRATNTGLSGVISPQGLTVDQGQQFTRQTVFSEIQLMRGSTPFSLLSSKPVIALCFALLLVCTYLRKAQRSFLLG
ncbi:MAG: apolipoprotein N-acyltransferase [Cellvibrionaceae bacterium]|nr:apolipoprotein N-acyltransferase [Cellvibrionaceae bacterium]